MLDQEAEVQKLLEAIQDLEELKGGHGRLDGVLAEAASLTADARKAAEEARQGEDEASNDAATGAASAVAGFDGSMAGGEDGENEDEEVMRILSALEDEVRLEGGPGREGRGGESFLPTGGTGLVSWSELGPGFVDDIEEGGGGTKDGRGASGGGDRRRSGPLRGAQPAGKSEVRANSRRKGLAEDDEESDSERDSQESEGGESDSRGGDY